MRPHRRRRPLEHVLVAGDGGEVEDIQRLLLLLPDDTYGQVYVAAGAQRHLQAPPRITVSWLAAGTEPGPVLSAAVHGWLAEWLPGDPQPEREFTLWLGRSAHAHLRDELDQATPVEQLATTSPS